MVEEDLKPIPSRGWAEMIRKIYEVDPMTCPKCGGTMKVVAFITDFQVVDRNHRPSQADVRGGEASALPCFY